MTVRPSTSARPLESARPLILSTWSFSERGNEAAWPGLAGGGDPMDAVLEACRVAEEDPEVNSVGWGGLPDAAGNVTLDGCVMRGPAQCGSACGLRRHLHPAHVARLVMERTPHVMLAGEAADEFASANGQPERALLSPAAREAWEKWRAAPNEEAAGQHTKDRNWNSQRALHAAQPHAADCNSGHDTIGSIAIGTGGRMAGACSTSGTPYKMPGRVGDSPIIGHGLYVDPAAGAATATGSGELIMGVCGAFLAVECMRHGATAAEAARAVVERVADAFAHTLRPHHQTGFIVVAPSGEWAAASLRPGFLVACGDSSGARLVPAGFVRFPE